MTAARALQIQAVVTQGEQPAMTACAGLLASSLSQAAQARWDVACAFPEGRDDVGPQAAGRVIVTSLLAEVATAEDTTTEDSITEDSTKEDWAVTEARLWSRYRGLCGGTQVPVFVCTVFRHVDRADARAPALLLRIRRLNLLAARMSRELGLLVIDLDRDLADLGAMPLQTDYRLAGPRAAFAAGKSAAMAVLLAGLDDVVPDRILQAARESLRALATPLPACSPVRPSLGRINILSLGTGTRRQTIQRAGGIAAETGAKFHLRRLLRRQIGAREALSALRLAAARHGWRQSFARLLIGLRSLVYDAPGQG